MAQYLTLPVGNLHNVPEEVADQDACFAEPLAAACRIAEQQVHAHVYTRIQHKASHARGLSEMVTLEQHAFSLLSCLPCSSALVDRNACHHLHAEVNRPLSGAVEWRQGSCDRRWEAGATCSADASAPGPRSDTLWQARAQAGPGERDTA